MTNLEERRILVDVVIKPWGLEEIFAHTDKYAGKIITVDKGCRLSLQFHKVKDETMYIVQGEALITLRGMGLDSTWRYSQGESIHIPHGVMHRVEAPISKVIIFEVSTPELEDVVRVKDDYGRI